MNGCLVVWWWREGEIFQFQSRNYGEMIDVCAKSRRKKEGGKKENTYKKKEREQPASRSGHCVFPSCKKKILFLCFFLRKAGKKSRNCSLFFFLPFLLYVLMIYLVTLPSFSGGGRGRGKKHCPIREEKERERNKTAYEEIIIGYCRPKSDGVSESKEEKKEQWGEVTVRGKSSEVK